VNKPRFSKDYRTYGKWFKAQPRDTRYAKEIIKKHQYFPDKSLNQLRKTKIADHDLSTVALEKLSKKDRKSRPRFSKDHKTYGEWLKAQPRDTKYAKEIIRKHQYFPDKNLNQLRKLKIADYDLSTKAWGNLSA
jgi:adenylate kinase family enzyme